MPLEKLSASAIRTYDTCQYKFKLAYIDKIPSPIKGNVHTSFGRAIHQSIENFYINKSKQLESLEREFLPIFVEELKLAEVHLDDKDVLKYIIRSKKCFKNFYSSFLDSQYFKEPFGIEVRFEVPYSTIKLIGYIDFVSKVDDGIIVDYKTGKNAPKPEQLKTDVQLSIYSLAAIKELKIEKPRLCLFYLDLNKKLFTERSDSDYTSFFTKIDGIINHAATNAFFEPNIDHCHYCEYQNMCQFSNNKKFYFKTSVPF